MTYTYEVGASCGFRAWLAPILSHCRSSWRHTSATCWACMCTGWEVSPSSSGLIYRCEEGGLMRDPSVLTDAVICERGVIDTGMWKTHLVVNAQAGASMSPISQIRSSYVYPTLLTASYRCAVTWICVVIILYAYRTQKHPLTVNLENRTECWTSKLQLSQ
jgi:hypothetical protein